jgi:hypothetical protein
MWLLISIPQNDEDSAKVAPDPSNTSACDPTLFTVRYNPAKITMVIKYAMNIPNINMHVGVWESVSGTNESGENLAMVDIDRSTSA